MESESHRDPVFVGLANEEPRDGAAVSAEIGEHWRSATQEKCRLVVETDIARLSCLTHLHALEDIATLAVRAIWDGTCNHISRGGMLGLG